MTPTAKMSEAGEYLPGVELRLGPCGWLSYLWSHGTMSLNNKCLGGSGEWGDYECYCGSFPRSLLSTSKSNKKILNKPWETIKCYEYNKLMGRVAWVRIPMLFPFMPTQGGQITLWTRLTGEGALQNSKIYKSCGGCWCSVAVNIGQRSLM